MPKFAVKVYRTAADLMSTTVVVEAASAEEAKAKAPEVYENSDDHFEWECEATNWAKDGWLQTIFEAEELDEGPSSD